MRSGHTLFPRIRLLVPVLVVVCCVASYLIITSQSQPTSERAPSAEKTDLRITKPSEPSIRAGGRDWRLIFEDADDTDSVLQQKVAMNLQQAFGRYKESEVSIKRGRRSAPFADELRQRVKVTHPPPAVRGGPRAPRVDGRLRRASASFGDRRTASPGRGCSLRRSATRVKSRRNNQNDRTKPKGNLFPTSGANVDGDRPIHCRERLGGLLRYYFREAGWVFLTLRA